MNPLISWEKRTFIALSVSFYLQSADSMVYTLGVSYTFLLFTYTQFV